MDVTLPRWGAMQEGDILEWRVEVGDRVEPGDVLVIVEAEKVTGEVEAPTSGVVAEILAAPGETRAPGAVIARIAPDDAAAREEAEEAAG